MTYKSPFEPAHDNLLLWRRLMRDCKYTDSPVFAARMNGTQIAIWASTRDFGTVTKAHVRLCKYADSPVFAARMNVTQTAIWASSRDVCTLAKAHARLCKYADCVESMLKKQQHNLPANYHKINRQLHGEAMKCNVTNGLCAWCCHKKINASL